MTFVSITTDVDIDLEDLTENLSPEGKTYLATLLKVDAETGRSPDGRTFEQIIETAFAAARALPAVPPALVDLFWVVHGRAMS